MEKTPLFPRLNGLLHGGDYNPEQWLDRPDILEEDVRLMREAGVNSATLGVFSWSVLEPQEGTFQLDWLRSIIDTLYKNGIFTILATPTGARPAWLDEAYPEAMRVAADGRRNHHGVRHNHCMSSPQFRTKAEIIIRKLAAALGDHPGVLLWHISNELGGACFCEHCRARFVEFLRARYENDIERLNHEWWTTFWSHRYNCFEQIEPPLPNGEGSIHGLNLDWKRFVTWNMNDYMMFEANLLRSLTPNVPITTNFMQLYNGLDYHAMADGLDIISWDSYPYWGTDQASLAQTAAETSFEHSVMRGMKPEKPFMLMESVPSQVNWHTFNKLKRPGVHLLSCLQAIACGSDTVQYFQWRKGRGSFEQYHGAVMDHLGHSNTRVFREVAETGAALQKLAQTAGTLHTAETALLFDWDNRWAIADAKILSDSRKLYEDTCRTQHALFSKHGVAMDIISPLADFSRYKVLVAPMLYMLKPGVAARLRAFVQGGGHLVATYLTGYVNENTLCWLGGFPGDGLTELFGLYSEEIDALYPTDTNAAVCSHLLSGTYTIRDYCEVIHTQQAEVLATYGGDFYENTPVLTRNAFGKGAAWYAAARLEDAGMEALYAAVWQQAGIATQPLPAGVEHHCRIGGGARYDFYLNWTREPQRVTSVADGVDLLSGAQTTGCVELAPLGAAVICHTCEEER